MQLMDKIDILRKTKKSYFVIEDLQKALRLKKSSLKKILGRMTKKKVIKRLARGVYVLPEKGIDVKKIASQLYAPCAYISFETALSVYGIIAQIPYMVTMATYKNTKVRSFLEGEIVLRRIKKCFFFGYKIEGSILIAKPEKALLDMIYMKSKGLASLNEEELNLGDLSKTRFLEMSKKFPQKVQKDAKRIIAKLRNKK